MEFFFLVKVDVCGVFFFFDEMDVCGVVIICNGEKKVTFEVVEIFFIFDKQVGVIFLNHLIKRRVIKACHFSAVQCMPAVRRLIIASAN